MPITPFIGVRNFGDSCWPGTRPWHGLAASAAVLELGCFLKLLPDDMGLIVDSIPQK